MATPSTPAATESAANTDLLGCEGVPAARLRTLLSRTAEIDERLTRGDRSLLDLLAGRAVGTLFFEDSTRTRMSFDLAAQRGGAAVIDLTAKASSISKGETAVDTALVVEAMGVDCLVVRAQHAGTAHAIASAVSCSVLNAGDGKHEHPTQALIDAYTLGTATGRTDWDFSGLKLAIVGDVVSSRVARSNAWAMTTLGAEVTLIGPAGLAPSALANLAPNVRIERDFDGALPGFDALMMLRVQFERHGDPGSGKGGKRSASMASVREYRAGYGLTPERAATMKDGAFVMHPGPMNRGVEIDGAVSDGPRSLILKQVAAGVPVRLAAMAECLGV